MFTEPQHTGCPHARILEKLQDQIDRKADALIGNGTIGHPDNDPDGMLPGLAYARGCLMMATMEALAEFVSEAETRRDDQPKPSRN